jgi:hypothetical protein
MTQCHQCGRELGEHPVDIAFSLPDVVWALDETERAKRATFDTDLCVLDRNRFFIRAIAYVPILQTDKHFGWGVWAEVSPAVFGRYLDLYRIDARDEPIASGVLANTPVGYPPMQDQAVDIAFGTAAERPRLTLHVSTHPLSLEQKTGITMARVHEINTLLRKKKARSADPD